MKLFLKFAFLGLALLTVLPLVPSSQLALHGSATVFAMEPASWLLVGFGLVGGGFLHKRRLRGLNLLSTDEGPDAAEAKRADGSLPPSPQAKTVEVMTAAHILSTSRRSYRAESLSPGKLWAAAATALMLVLVTNTASADTVSFNSQLVSSIALSPSSDTVSLNGQSGTIDTTQGAFTFQTGDFTIGDSEIPDQVITFSLQDTLTLNGITQTLTINGQDAVTQSADTLTIFGGSPVAFGNDLFTLQTFTLSSPNMGDLPIDLQATVTPTPEPSSLLLLGTGIICGALATARRKAPPAAELPRP